VSRLSIRSPQQAFTGAESRCGSQAETTDERVPVEPAVGKAGAWAGEVNRPNGLAFSPDESKLSVVEATKHVAGDS
jgi:hypothetical protein